MKLNFSMALGPKNAQTLIDRANSSLNDDDGQKFHRIIVTFEVDTDLDPEEMLSKIKYFPVDQKYIRIDEGGLAIEANGCPYPPKCTGIGFINITDDCKKTFAEIDKIIG